MSLNIKQINSNGLDSIELRKLEKEWKRSSPRFTDREWLAIFPEAELYLKKRLKMLKKEVKIIAPEIKEYLMNIYSKGIEDKFTIWFAEEIVSVWKGNTLNKLNNEILKLQLLLNPERNTSSRIADSMIKKARQYPFKDLIKTKNNFALCPFHPDKRPSFHIRDNQGHCFGCNWHGDTIQFLIDRDGLNFQEAIKYLT